MKTTNGKKRTRWVWVLVLILCLGIVGSGGGWLAWYYFKPQEDLSQFRSPTILTPSVQQNPDQSGTTPDLDSPGLADISDEPLPDNPVDFYGLWQINEDVIAWIVVPGTDIDLPVMMTKFEVNDNWYLHRNIRGSYDYKGCLYVQKLNEKDFSDPVTVIYGHNMLDTTMFSNLTLFQDPQFFADHDTFTVYIPGHILTYTIVSAHQYEKKHILNSFDFSQKDVLQEYVNIVLSPPAVMANVREGVSVTTDDRIVTLSTCIEHGRYRYLVQGVLTNDQRTN